MSMFFDCHQSANSFLYSVFFDKAYRECTFERLRFILKNRLHLKKRFAAYYFPEANEQTLKKLLRMDHPDVIDILIHHSMDRVQESYFLYIFMNFDSVLQALYDLVMEVYGKIDALRRSALPNTCVEAIERESVFSKLKAITNAKEVNESDFIVSLSLMEADLLSFRTNERDFVLLGYDFEKWLETEYKYCDITLFTFSQAIASNPVKYEIFNALLEQAPLTSADLSTKLRLSRSSLDYNLNEMVKSGLLLAEPINKRTYNYRINTEYLRIISRQLNVILN